MNGAQLHLALNHLPVVLSLVSFFTLTWGWTRNNTEIKRVGLIFATATAVFAGMAYFTGDPAEDVLKDFLKNLPTVPSFPKAAVHEHEEAGEAALIVSILCGLAAASTLFLKKKNHRFASAAWIITFLLSLVSTTSFLRTAHLGGLIRHEEIASPSNGPAE